MKCSVAIVNTSSRSIGIHTLPKRLSNYYRNGRYGNTRWRSVNSRLDWSEDYSSLRRLLMRISVLTARKHNNTNFQRTEMSPNLNITEKFTLQIRHYRHYYRNGNGATTVTCDNPFNLWWLWGWHQHKERKYNISKELFFFCKLNVIYWGIKFPFVVLMLGIVGYVWLHKTISSYTMNSSTLLAEAEWEITSWRKLQSVR